MPEATLRVLTVVDSAAIQWALALMTGTLASEWWLRRATSAWARAVVRLSRRWRLVGILSAFVAEGASLWLQAMALLDEPTATVGPMIGVVLRETHFGRAWGFGVAALLVALFATAKWAGGKMGLAACAVAAFAFSRSVVSHAGAQGDFSVEVGVDGIHLLLVCLWVGMLLFGVVVLRQAPHDASDGRDAARWISALSRTATVALLFIVITGAVKVGWATPSLPMLAGSTYGQVLFVKLLLVATAVALGGFNRFRTMPGVLRGLVESNRATASLQGRFVHILWLEAAVLVAAVVSAAVLSSTPRLARDERFSPSSPTRPEGFDREGEPLISRQA